MAGRCCRERGISPMFEWTEERVSFMADACERTDFHEKLAALL